MKTKIIYISGNEVFDMHDIRAAFEEVRCALNLDKNTVLFGVPVDTDDACLMNDSIKEENVKEPVIEETKEIIPETIPTPVEEEIVSIQEQIEEEPIVEEIIDTVEEEMPAPKKRGRPRKEQIIDEPVVEKEIDEETVVETPTEETKEEKTIPILSVLSANEKTDEIESENTTDVDEQIDIITDITEETTEDVSPEQIEESIAEPVESVEEESEPDLEKLLSEMTPLQEDTLDETLSAEPVVEDDEPDLSVDATLEQLASEFVSSQDKIASETKSQSRSKIGKLRNILPFKQSKHKDQGIGDLLEWAGIAANDEDFSVPGFFTNAASRK